MNFFDKFCPGFFRKYIIDRITTQSCKHSTSLVVLPDVLMKSAVLHDSLILPSSLLFEARTKTTNMVLLQTIMAMLVVKLTAGTMTTHFMVIVIATDRRCIVFGG
jgi:hypothetical protein